MSDQQFQINRLIQEVDDLQKLVGQTIECVISGDTGTVNLLGPPEAVEAVKQLKADNERLRAAMAHAVEGLADCKVAYDLRAALGEDR